MYSATCQDIIFIIEELNRSFRGNCAELSKGKRRKKGQRNKESKH